MSFSPIRFFVLNSFCPEPPYLALRNSEVPQSEFGVSLVYISTILVLPY